eukprot:CAMPEP_0171729176 /NCGR_PEP_ID=MMETSP0991-20121206/27446_1 /TAXON_ID=483369 /ORGANISM="non described non described, Strain CCMP2098" /LENGTH=96 /DNA_ID=CAMNT_0012323481 /DNA_START=21 /DNA_END=312 /DNA_ORIENTATION=-
MARKFYLKNDMKEMLPPYDDGKRRGAAGGCTADRGSGTTATTSACTGGSTRSTARRLKGTRAPKRALKERLPTQWSAAKVVQLGPLGVDLVSVWDT